MHLASGPFDIYSFWGIVWVHLCQNAISIKTTLLIPAFRNMDATMEEAAQVSGANVVTTLRRVVIPLMAPAIIVTVVAGMTVGVQFVKSNMVPAGMFSFVAASRDVSNIILLASGQSMTLAPLQLDYMVAPLWESATVVAVIMTLIITGVALVARACNLNLGVK